MPPLRPGPGVAAGALTPLVCSLKGWVFSWQGLLLESSGLHEQSTAALGLQAIVVGRNEDAMPAFT